jgi:hypothetical protein
VFNDPRFFLSFDGSSMVPKGKSVFQKLPLQSDPTSSKILSLTLARGSKNNGKFCLGFQEGASWIYWDELHNLFVVRCIYEQHVAAPEHTSDHYDAATLKHLVCA